MTRQQSLKAALAADAAVTALVQDRVYPLIALPPDMENTIACEWAVTCDYTLSSVGAVSAMLEVRCWSADFDVAHQIAAAVRAVLSPAGAPGGFRGLLGGAGGIDVKQCLWAANGMRETERYVAIATDKFMFEVRSHYDLLYDL